MSKLEKAAREVIRQHSMECLTDKAVDAMQEALAEQAEQEPEVWYCPDCGTLSELQVKCCPDWIRSRKVPKNFALTCKATFDRNVQAEQEPVMITPGGGAFPFAVVGEFEQAEQEPVCVDWDTKTDEPIMGYAAPVRTKDLTDDEIAEACGWKFGQPMYEWVIGLARAVIAADREKNNV